MQKKQPVSTQPMFHTSCSTQSQALSDIDPEILSKWAALSNTEIVEGVISRGIKLVQLDLIESFNGIAKYQSILCLAFKFTEKGKHRRNHYHNVHHCYAVAKQCNSYLRSSNELTLSKEEELALYLAALFHDYNHSGKSLAKIEDKENINNAIIGLLTFQLELTKLKFGISDEIDVDYIIGQATSAIKSTMVKLVDGKVVFGKKPNTNIKAVLRDSDVTMMLDPFGRLLMPGLAKEFGMPYDENFKLSSINFQKKVKLYTDAACKTREEQMPYLEKTWAITVGL